jgi:hypothetical protein
MPDQKVSSKDWALRFSVRNRRTFSKMIAHDQKEAISRAIITALTTQSACMNRP